MLLVVRSARWMTSSTLVSSVVAKTTMMAKSHHNFGCAYQKKAYMAAAEDARTKNKTKDTLSPLSNDSSSDNSGVAGWCAWGGRFRRAEIQEARLGLRASLAL
jgi:hypothetical protein